MKIIIVYAILIILPSYRTTSLCSFRKCPKGEKIILDVDPGSDDAIAITLALRAEKMGFGCPVIAITCSNGNTNLRNVLINVERVLEVNDRQDIPVYPGANGSLVYTQPSDSIFGSDGMGEVPYNPMNLVSPQKEHAVLALLRLANKYSGDITIISSGAITNLVLAQRLDPMFLSKLKNVFILGGSIAGLGNIAPGIEFNVYMDTEAFHVVFESVKSNYATLLPWDPVRRNSLTQEYWTTTFGSSQLAATQFLNQIIRIFFTRSTLADLADPVLFAAYLDPRVIEQSEELLVTVVTDGAGRGSTLVDYNHRRDSNGTNTNLNVILAINLDAYKKILQALLL